MLRKIIPLLPLCAFAASPVVESVSYVQVNPGKIAIDYTLSGADAIVTLDVLTNGVSIGGENIQYLSGDVNRTIETGPRTIYWAAAKSWEGHKVDSGVTFEVKAWATNTPPDYLVADLSLPQNMQWFTAPEFFPDGGLTNGVYATSKLVMRRIPAAGAIFRMGSTLNEIGRNAANETPHSVSFTNDFYISIYKLTIAQYEKLTGKTVTWGYIAPTNPIVNRNFVQLRGSADEANWPLHGHSVTPTSDFGLMRAASGINFDLPTDAQWEFACRAGCVEEFSFGGRLAVNDNNLASAAPYYWTSQNNSPAGVKPVGQKLPNNWGLYDMGGNVWELCLDWYQADLGQDDAIDPTGPDSSADNVRVQRGGGYGSGIKNARSAARSTTNPTANTSNNAYSANGFRIVAPITLK